VLILIGGFGVVLVQVRFDHRSVLGEDIVPWIPIVYSILMIVVSALGLLFWDRGGRKALLMGFLLGILVGLAGFWFHTNGRLVRSVQHEFSAWVRKIPDEDKPPALAPLAFAGFGVLGALACSKNFQPLPAQKFP
jgi:Na+/proline symporter